LSKLELTEKGSPVLRSEVVIFPEKLSQPTRVKDSQWAGDPKPWTQYKIKNKMHHSIEVHYFYRLGKSLPEGNIANLGVGQGFSVAALAYGLRESGKTESLIHGIDLYRHMPEMTKSRLEEMYKSLGLHNYIRLYEGYTQDWADNFKNVKFIFLLIDADHYYETCKLDYEMWSPMVEVGGLMAFHDVNVNHVDRVIEELDSTKWEQIEHIACTKTFKRLR